MIEQLQERGAGGGLKSWHEIRKFRSLLLLVRQNLT